MIQKMALDEFDSLGEIIIEGYQLSDDDLRFLLSLESEKDLERLHSAARKVRDYYLWLMTILSLLTTTKMEK